MALLNPSERVQRVSPELRHLWRIAVVLGAALLGFAVVGPLVAQWTFTGPGGPGPAAVGLFACPITDPYCVSLQATTEPPPVCGDGKCDVGEDPDTCLADCPKAPFCGDGSCDPGEDSSTCPQDCEQTMPTCPNGSCDPGEDYNTCPADCSPPTLDWCGNGTCGPTENSDTCPEDCPKPQPVCGNGQCEEGEDYSNCADDCSPPSIDWCGNGRCGQYENPDNCPQDCKVSAVCGNGSCEAGEDSNNCAADCPSTGMDICGNGFCGPTEDKSTCPQDCLIATETPLPQPTNTPLPPPTRTPTPIPTQESAAGEPTQPPSPAPPSEQPSSPPTTESEQAALQPTAEALLESTAEVEIPPTCNLVSLDDIPADVRAALADLEGNLAVMGDRVLICTGQPSEVCLPYNGPNEGLQIVDCDSEGRCIVRSAAVEGTAGGVSLACVRPTIWRRMLRCDGACAPARGLAETPPTVAEVAVPGGIALSLVTAISVGAVMLFSRRGRSFELDQEEDDVDDGLITGEVTHRPDGPA